MLPRLIALLFAIASTTLGADVPPPDPRTGNVNGIAGLLFWPADLPAPHGEPRPLATADGCTVHVVPVKEPDRELTYPCGKWLALPSAGQHTYWLETNGRMTPTAMLVFYSRSPFAGRGLPAIVPVAPAGRVAIPSNRKLPDNEGLRLLSIEARDSWGGRILDRRVSAADAHSTVQMPVGRVVVGRFDRKTNDAVALSRPVEITAGRTAVVWPTPPGDSDVLLVLTKPPEQQLRQPFGARLSLEARAPDVMLNGFDRIIAIWYGVAARHATVAMESDAAFWAPHHINLTRGEVTTLRSTVQRLPKAQVSINVPPGVTIAEKLSLSVVGAAERPVRGPLAVRPGTHELRDLPPEMLATELRIGEWRLSETLDLSSGADGAVSFDLQPIAVTGTVFFGEERAAAEIEFLNRGEWRAVRTDARGDYATTFWWPDSHTARVKIAGRNLPPYLDSFREILQSGTLDFHVPRTDYIVRVRDASSGRPIAGAAVNVGSESAGGRKTSQRLATGDDGVAVLPPLRNGELIVSVRAERYATPEPLRVAVDDQHHEIDVALRPLRAAATLDLRLANGAPAAQADAWAFDAAMSPVWRGAADGEGHLELPESTAGGFLLIRHAMAASTIRPAPAADRVAWTLDAPAAPLTLVASARSPEQARGALVALWLDGVKLSGPPLSFAAWSTPATNPSGVWVGRNLPPRPLRVLLVLPAAFASSAFDAVARQVDYPWSAPVAAPVQ